MKEKQRQVLKAAIFCMLTSMIFIGVNWFIQPMWTDWGNYDRIYGFYEEPENTMETVFLGSSSTITGITPMELYENYGICAYNLASEQQPMLVSYYWLEEAYRMHSDTLKTVILDCSGLSRSHQDVFCRKAIDGMKLSSVKFRAVRDYTDHLYECFAYMIPIFSYHSRWSELTKTDFEKLEDIPDSYLRGYGFGMGRYLDAGDYRTLDVPEYVLDEDGQQSELNDEALLYLKKMVDFCNEKGINMILMKTPVSGWSSSNHHAIAAIAEKYQLTFFDFNVEELMKELQFNYALDSGDGGHLNYYGATKLTDWLGAYLLKQKIATDVRKDPRYHFMREELKQYQANISDVVKLNAEKDPCTYLSLAGQNPDRTIFVAVRGDAAGALTENQRQKFSELGLEKLAKLEKQDSYLAVVNGKEEVYEQVQAHLSEEMLLDADLRSKMAGGGINQVEQLHNGIWYSLTSGGDTAGDTASCCINGKQYARNGRGLNFVVYDNLSQEVVDSACFDTSVSSTREGDITLELEKALAGGKSYTQFSERLKNLYLYHYRCERMKNIKIFERSMQKNDFWRYFSEYRNSENTIVFLCVKGDAVGMLNPKIRNNLSKIGLHKLAGLEYKDSYLAVIEEGTDILELKGQKGILVETNGIGYKIFSGKSASGYMDSIFIHGKEYVSEEQGMHVVVFDKQLDMVIDHVVFT